MPLNFIIIVRLLIVLVIQEMTITQSSLPISFKTMRLLKKFMNKQLPTKAASWKALAIVMFFLLMLRLFSGTTYLNHLTQMQLAAALNLESKKAISKKTRMETISNSTST